MKNKEFCNSNAYEIEFYQCEHLNFYNSYCAKYRKELNGMFGKNNKCKECKESEDK